MPPAASQKGLCSPRMVALEEATDLLLRHVGEILHHRCWSECFTKQAWQAKVFPLAYTLVFHSGMQ